MAEENQAAGPSAEQVTEAKSLGWAPEDQWRGDKEKWVNADVFLERGLGIHHVRREAETARSKAEGLTAENAALAGKLRAIEATVAALEESREADITEAKKEEKARLQADYAEALKDGDHVRAAEIAGEMAENAALVATPAKKAGETEPPKIQLHPEVVAWNTENQDFMTDRRRVALANVVANELRAAGDKRIGKAFLDDVRSEVDKSMGTPRRSNGTSKVEGDTGGGGNRGGGSGGGGGKSYADLPAEAKAVCDKQAARLVGPGRAHKDAASWRASYARQYFNNEAS